ncbi:MAG: NAD(P)H-dependent glycerol-3-phosphate dehydrogenase [Candidatus Competibacteraceae bacterium]|jgi:glycerol-3-phosphate dehydrogenase (NAD(P)+)|nr:NAD(P)H-dependent glycerol-3-phosphate dehydrogenase [Candidatus Competibacteraceae bacterium]
MSTTQPVAVTGAGSWGTALALLLARRRYPVRLWGHNPAHLARLRQERENRRHLPGINFPPHITVPTTLAATVADTQWVFVAVPSHAYAETLLQLHPLLAPHTGIAWATKGLEHGSGRFLHVVTANILGPDYPAVVISGPSFAGEVAKGLPTAVTVAASIPDHAQRVAGFLHGPDLRAYSSTDVVGVELGGAVKNVLAIAAGVSDGLGFGANARAALITRGLAEMMRLGEAVGAQPVTLMGLAGVGDLILTCTDDQSRNRRFGLALGRGQSAAAAQADIGQVVEGIATARTIIQLARQHGVDMPITEQVERVLRQEQNPRQAVEMLLARDPKPEVF